MPFRPLRHPPTWRRPRRAPRCETNPSVPSIASSAGRWRRLNDRCSDKQLSHWATRHPDYRQEAPSQRLRIPKQKAPGRDALPGAS